MKKYIQNILVVVMVIGLFSCEQERLEPVLTAADGGGTLNTYTAYVIDSNDPTGSNVNGRIVFYKTTLDQTLVQISLYNTIDGIMHPALLVEGPVETGTTTMMALDNIEGNSGEFASNKFFVITDTAFYDSIMMMDSHISISLSPTDNTIVATGNLGVNADPVDTN